MDPVLLLHQGATAADCADYLLRFVASREDSSAIAMR